MIQFFIALDFDIGVDFEGTDDNDYDDDHHDDASGDDDDDDDYISFSGSYQVSGWAVNGRELAATTTNPSSYMILHHHPLIDTRVLKVFLDNVLPNNLHNFHR